MGSSAASSSSAFGGSSTIGAGAGKEPSPDTRHRCGRGALTGFRGQRRVDLSLGLHQVDLSLGPRAVQISKVFDILGTRHLQQQYTHSADPHVPTFNNTKQKDKLYLLSRPVRPLPNRLPTMRTPHPIEECPSGILYHRVFDLKNFAFKVFI
jgi:hypothetical protein